MVSTFCFSVHSQPSPCSLPRVLEVFAAHGLVPRQCHSQLTADPWLVIDLQLDDLTAEQARRLALRIERVLTVEKVLFSAKRLASLAAA